MIGPRLIDLGNPVADHPLNRGLVGWWLCLPHSMGGSRFFDLAGRNHGTLTNGPAWQPGGRPGGYGAISFDGSNDYVSLGTNAIGTAINGSAACTLSCWLRYQSLEVAKYANLVIGSVIGTGSAGVWVNIRGDGGSAGLMLAGGRSQSSDSFQETSSAVSASANVWSHWAIVFNYAGDTIAIAKDGVLASPASVTFGASAYTHTSASAVDEIASFGTGIPEYFLAGTLDDVRLYSRALSAAEVAALYDQSRRGHPDTLRRYTPRAWYLPYSAGGGTTHTQSLTGALSLAPALVKRDRKALSVALSLSASPARKSKKALTASLSLSASLAKKAKAALSAALSLTGALAKRVRRAISASLSLAGELTTRSFVLHVLSLSATLSLSGALTRKANKGLSASLSLAGNLARRARKGLSAALSLAGAVAKRASKALTAALSLAGLLSSEVSEAVDSTPPILDMSRDFARTVSMSKNFTRTIDQAFDWVEE